MWEVQTIQRVYLATAHVIRDPEACWSRRAELGPCCRGCDPWECNIDHIVELQQVASAVQKLQSDEVCEGTLRPPEGPCVAATEVKTIANSPINLQQLCHRADNGRKAQLVKLLLHSADSLNGAGYAHDMRTVDVATQMAQTAETEVARAVFHVVAADAFARAAAFEERMRAAAPAAAAALGWRR